MGRLVTRRTEAEFFETDIFSDHIRLSCYSSEGEDFNYIYFHLTFARAEKLGNFLLSEVKKAKELKN